MPTLKNHEVWIESDGQRYEEYNIKVEGDVVTCYIASQAGKNFRIIWKNHSDPLDVSSEFEFKLDGITFDGFVSNHLHGAGNVVSKGYWIDESSYKAYRFSDVKLSDDEGTSLISNDFGTIIVVVNRVHLEEIRDYLYVPLEIPNDMRAPLNERSKKIGSHRVDLDDTVQKSNKLYTYYNTIPYKGETNPFVTVRFIYRPKEILQALDVVPASRSERNKGRRSPSPISGPSSARSRGDERRQKAIRQSPKVKAKVEVIDLSDDDQTEQELLAQRADANRRLKQLRKRKNHGSTKVKRETRAESNGGHSVDLSQFLTDANGTIDLTGG